ncbi:hypothetical protein CLAIMM_04098 [Cladophialophora immunda]|nr:hypothetical protein CLAIMM_04098 [Cladophialophora immunda]
MMAQRYPEDFDGILADAPAVYWVPIMMHLEYPLILMRQEDYFPTPCEFDAFTSAAVQLCDGLDGFVDGIISEPDSCPFDPQSLVGKSITCDGKNVTLNQATAAIFQGIHDGFTSPGGRKMWSGYNWGTVMSPLPPSSTNLSVTLAAIADSWARVMVEQDNHFDTADLTRADWMEVYIQSYIHYGGVIDTADPDLTPFRDHGGKLLTWQGLGDNSVPPNGTKYYRSLVEGVVGGPDEANAFHRLFFAPGVGHCGTGTGAIPTDAMDKLVAWVEQGQAPTNLSGTWQTLNGIAGQRPICMYPHVAQYKGRGDITVESSYECVQKT